MQCRALFSPQYPYGWNAAAGMDLHLLRNHQRRRAGVAGIHLLATEAANGDESEVKSGAR